MKKKRKDDGSMKYNYTENENRELWLTHIYPLGNMILSKIVSKIPWNTYRFEGYTLCEILTEDETVVTTNLEGVADFSGVDEFENYQPYYIFGGSACELYSKMYPEIGNIHNIVDPTSDIDVRIYSPTFKPFGDYSYNDISLVMKDESYTKLNEHFTGWLFEEIVSLCDEVEHYFHESIFSVPDKMYDSDIVNADLITNVGPLLISRVLLNEDDMIKIQISTKIGEISDHFIEFVLPINNTLDFGGAQQKTPIFRFESLFIQHPINLFFDQLKALVSRSKIIDDKHKFYNHCARVLYLTELLQFLRINGIIERRQLNDKILRNNFDILCKPICGLDKKILQTIDLLSSKSPPIKSHQDYYVKSRNRSRT
jgi:hypothetical protein